MGKEDRIATAIGASGHDTILCAVEPELSQRSFYRVSSLLMRITDHVRLAIEEQALGARPSECCGLLSGKDSLITNIHPLPNAADKPQTRYFAAPEDLFAAMRRIRKADQMLLGIYHSHPRAPAYPSVSDVEMAFYPEAIYFIISLEPRIDLRAFKIEGSRIEDVELTVVNAR